MNIQRSTLVVYIFLMFSIHNASTTLLDFSNSNLTQVPPAPESITVTVLNLKRNRIEELKQISFRRYHHLIEIDLSSNGLRILHDGVFDNVTTLRKISFYNNKLIRFPDRFGPSTTRLGFINLINAVYNPRIFSFPYFGAFINLRTVYIASAMNDNLNDSFYPPNIHTLGLNLGYMDTFPRLSSLTPSLSVIHLTLHKIKTIPQEAIAELFSLRTANFDGNKINNFPNFSHCKKLVLLSLASNEISHIPRQHIEGLHTIQEMHLSNNLLSTMVDISYLANLHTFFIGHNFISEIRKEFLVGLQNMQAFSIDYNRLELVPNISGLFPQLRELNVKGNNLKTLPDLYDLQSLLSLTAAENPYVCNMSLCWLRMLPWIKPNFPMLRDNPLCDQPTSLADTGIMRFHPTEMGCYDGMCFIRW